MRTIIRNNYDPNTSDYHETIVIDDEREKKWLFDCDGVVTDITSPKVVSESGNSEDYAASQKWVTEIEGNLADETQNRIDADGAIWTEIENIEMSSDVVDIVGTYAELQQYDTSKLHDNDIIKVLQDSTHQDETAYYRWSTTTSTFSYVGSEGPYYTESEIDTMMSGKQDKLIAGTNISIAADGKTISATDTTYTAGTGIIIRAPFDNAIDATYHFDLELDQPTAGACQVTASSSPVSSGDLWHLYSIDSVGLLLTFTVNGVTNDAEVIDMKTESGYYKFYLQCGEKIYILSYNGLSTNIASYVVIDLQAAMTGASAGAAGAKGLVPAPAIGDQGKFLQGDGTWATITIPSYSDFIGATSLVAGTHGLVPAPTTSDPDKFLKGDGTWSAVDPGGTIFYFKEVQTDFFTFYTDSACTTVAKLQDMFDAMNKGSIYVQRVDSDTANLADKYIYPLSLHMEVDKTLTPAEVTNLSVAFSNFSGVSVLSGWNNPTHLSDNMSSLTITYTPYVTSLPAANASTAGIGKLYTTTGQNTDGAVTQKLFTDTVGDIETALQILNSGAGVPNNP